jgi:FkbM family methyltransferase
MITKDELRRNLLVRRPGVTSDDDWGQLTVIHEYRYLPIKDRRVMDVGGNIGAFALRASLEGCDLCISYEPERSNFVTLQKNVTDHPRVLAVNAAVTTKPTGTPDTLWLTNERTLGSSSTTEFRGRTPQPITTVNFTEELFKYGFTSIKMDCEGQEWDLLLEADLPDFVTDIAVEIHFTKRRWRDHYFPLLMAKMGAWEPLIMPKNTGKNFHTLAHWRRS